MVKFNESRWCELLGTSLPNSTPLLLTVTAAEEVAEEEEEEDDEEEEEEEEEELAAAVACAAIIDVSTSICAPAGVLVPEAAAGEVAGPGENAPVGDGDTKPGEEDALAIASACAAAAATATSANALTSSSGVHNGPAPE